MIGFWPSVRDERLMTLRGQARQWPVADRAALAVRLITPWRSNGPVLAAVFFALTTLAVVATSFLFDSLQLPNGWITAGLCILVAEVLILRKRWFGTGVESALWLGGLVAWIVALEGQARAEVLLLFAAAALIAAARVRSAFFFVLGFVLAVSYLGARQWWIAAFATALALAIGALFALRREWQRPSTERALAAMLIAMPIAGAYATGDRLPQWWAIGHLAFAALCIAFGIRQRMHAPLIAAFVNFAIVAVEWHDLVDVDIEWLLVSTGVVLLGVAIGIARRLHGKTTGIVVTPETLTPFDDALPILVAATAAPAAHASPTDDTRGDGGGSFGGAGASGQF